jgi:hypothetical protein
LQKTLQGNGGGGAAVPLAARVRPVAGTARGAQPFARCTWNLEHTSEIQQWPISGRGGVMNNKFTPYVGYENDLKLVLEEVLEPGRKWQAQLKGAANRLKLTLIESPQQHTIERVNIEYVHADPNAGGALFRILCSCDYMFVDSDLKHAVELYIKHAEQFK